jgi:hypothetical protein
MKALALREQWTPHGSVSSTPLPSATLSSTPESSNPGTNGPGRFRIILVLGALIAVPTAVLVSVILEELAPPEGKPLPKGKRAAVQTERDAPQPERDAPQTGRDA